MNRTALCIKLLLKLYSVERIDRTEIAKYLECNERNVKEYINELRTAGYQINSFKGKYGGYSLEKNEFFPVNKFTTEEIKAIEQGLSFIQNRQDFIEKDKFSLAVAKILANSRNNSSAFNSVTIIEKYPLSMSKDELKKRFDIINESIINNQKIKVSYQAGNTNKSKEYIIHPYMPLIYNNNWYIIAWNEALKNTDPIGIYKLNRFEDIQILNDKFTRIKTFDENDYFDNLSFQIQDKIMVKIEFKNVNTAIKERIYGNKQVLTEIDNNTIILECMMNEFDAVALVLGYGENARVIEPIELRLKVQEQLKNALKAYE